MYESTLLSQTKDFLETFLFFIFVKLMLEPEKLQRKAGRMIRGVEQFLYKE